MVPLLYPGVTVYLGIQHQREKVYTRGRSGGLNASHIVLHIKLDILFGKSSFSKKNGMRHSDPNTHLLKTSWYVHNLSISNISSEQFNT